MPQVVECLFSKCEAPSTLRTTERERQKRPLSVVAHHRAYVSTWEAKTEPA
jgi:hypothetical protein